MRYTLLILAAFISVSGASCTGVRPTHLIRRDAEFQYAHARFEEATAGYQELVDRNPGDWQAQYWLGVCLLETGAPSDARLALEQAHSLKPGREEVADALAEAMFQTGAENELFAFLREQADQSRSTRAYLNLARYSVELGDLDSASIATLTAIEIDEGRSVEPYLARAALAARLGNSSEVVRRLRQAYGINPYDQRISDKLREYGEIPGPTFALPPGK